MADAAPTFRFADFEADPRARELRKHGLRLKLRGQPFALLLLLLERAGEVVTRDELRKQLWAADAFVDFEHGVNTAVKSLRQALGDSPRQPRLIETLPRIGYRFLAPVERIQSSRSERVMLVVLPFENLTGDPAQEYFSDGLTEEIIIDLGTLASARLGLIARTSAMAYKRSRKPIAEIARELGADFAVEGSVRRDRDRLRISAQLIRAGDQTHVWAQNYDCELRNILAVQDELGRAIADQVQVRLEPREAAPGRALALPPEAHDAYLRGRACFHHLTRPELLTSIKCFERAAALAPRWSPPWAGLAMVHATLPITSDFSSTEAFAKAKAAARKALSLDPAIGDAHVALCAAHFWGDWDWPRAAEEGRKAIALDCNSVWAHLRYGHVLSNQGRHDEAIEEAARARLLDPVAPMANAMSGMYYYQARRYRDAVPHFARALEINPRFWVAHINFSKLLHHQGRNEEALAEAQKAREFSGGSAEPTSMEGFLLARMGRRAEAQMRLDELELAAKQSYVPPYYPATVYLGLEEMGKALEWLERGRRERDVHMVFLGVDPKWDALRADARFARLLRRIRPSAAAGSFVSTDGRWIAGDRTPVRKP